ncbi:MAG: hypothetical protein ABIK43_04095 [candidate division WOR-3 bacterium]
MPYSRDQVVDCVDACVRKLVECIKNNKENEFNLETEIRNWAGEKIAEGDLNKFLEEARELFDIEVVVRGLRERSAEAGLSEDVLRSRRMIFSPVYKLYHESRPLDEEED